METLQLIESLNKYQAELINKVLSAFQSRGLEFGRERYENWRRRFIKFLDQYLPGESERLSGKLIRLALVSLRGETAAQRFWREDGEIINAFIDSIKQDLEEGTYEAPERIDSSRGQATTHEADIALVERICRRIAHSGRILLTRQRKGKNPYTIEDEYDVQDLLHAILRAYLKYSVQEDPLPKVAGTSASRADISIEDLGILIEVKYVYGPDDQKRILSDFSQDLVLYAAWTPLETLLFVIYNSADLRDPEALEKLSGVKEINGKRFNAKIILA